MAETKQVTTLGTIKRKQLPIKLVLLDNQRLGMVRQWQELFFEQRYSETILTDIFLSVDVILEYLQHQLILLTGCTEVLMGADYSPSGLS